jgi:2-octaprenyl-6-methoxyphenol hydroxylase
MATIAIIGGGIVGMTLAASLQQASHQILLVDATDTTGIDPRLIALNHQSIALLERIGVWSELVAHAAPINTVHVSHRGNFGMMRLTAQQLGLNFLGYVIPATKIIAALSSHLASKPQIQWLRAAKLTQINNTIAPINFIIEQSGITKNFSAEILIAADGTFSTVRQLLALTSHEHDYDQKALVTITDLKRSHQNIAYERFHQTGAIAMLPLPGLKAATIWTDNTIRIDELMQLPEKYFVAELQKVFGYRLGRFCAISERYVYPLKMLRTEQAIHNNIILIGNAAHTLHPIAAQGLNIALAETAFLSEYFATQPDLVMTPKMSQEFMAIANHGVELSHQLSSLFTNDFFVVSALRKLGLVGLDLLPSLKKRFAKIAITAPKQIN